MWLDTYVQFPFVVDRASHSDGFCFKQSERCNQGCPTCDLVNRHAYNCTLFGRRSTSLVAGKQDASAFFVCCGAWLRPLSTNFLLHQYSPLAEQQHCSATVCTAMSRPSLAQLQEQVQQLKEAEGIVDQPEKVVLQDAAAVKHKLDQTAAQVSVGLGTAPACCSAPPCT